MHLIILIFSFFSLSNTKDLDWRTLIHIKSDKIIEVSKPVTAINNKTESEIDKSEIIQNIPEWLLMPKLGFIFPSPLSRPQVMYPMGLGFSSLYGLDFEMLAVIPSRIRLALSYYKYLYDPRFYRHNFAFNIGLALFSRGGEFLQSFFSLRSYSPSMGLRYYVRFSDEFTGIFIDNKYEFNFEDGIKPRILLLIGIFTPL